MTTLCIIPARGGSKRIARKNIRDFAGRPMLSYPLRAALNAGVFDHVHVSTEDAEIAAFAAAAGAAPDFLRDPSLADDHTPVRDVVRADLESFERRGRRFDTIMLLYATATTVNITDMTGGLTAFSADPSRPLLAVARAQTPLERFLAVKDGVLIPAQAPERFASRTQDLTTVYKDAGAFAIYSAQTLHADTDGAAAMAFRPFELPAWKAIDIDTEDDWRHAEIITAGLRALEETA